jgi:hypothetical protein
VAITTSSNSNNNKQQQKREREKKTFPTEQTTHVNNYVNSQSLLFFSFFFDYIVSIISSIFKIDRTVSVAKRIALTETSNG